MPYNTDEAPSCRTCGTKRFIAQGAGFTTCVGYYSPQGHNHDNNCKVARFQCENGHWRNYSLRRKCPSCDWASHESCGIEDHGPSFFRLPEIEAPSIGAN
jgi:hypothetical protein